MEGRMPLRCVLGWHRWSKWVDVGSGDLQLRVPGGPPKLVGWWLRQRRSCPDCNRKETRLEQTEAD
jgi:hypothetical protein